ncbi:MAG: hypothetical protein WC319_13385 [Candidatus Paceibacterota bacterium]
MRKFWESFMRSVRLATKTFKELFAVILLIVFGFLMGYMVVYILSVNVILGLVSFLPSLFVFLVVMYFWWDVTKEWGS